MEIESTSIAWKANVLPLNYFRDGINVNYATVNEGIDLKLTVNDVLALSKLRREPS